MTTIVDVDLSRFDAAVYQLGNNGTARELLKAWPLT